MNLGFVPTARFVRLNEPHEAAIVISFAGVALARSVAPHAREDGLGFRSMVRAGDLKSSQGFLRRDE
jgi:hypothetical protein